MQSGIIHMLISAKELERQSELNHANRAFAAMVGGQQYENITREEAKRLAAQQRKHPREGCGDTLNAELPSVQSSWDIEARGRKL